MAEKIELKVHLARDDESGIWYVAESDIPGLRLEAGSAAALMQRIEHAAPEMIALNIDEIVERHRALAAPAARLKPGGRSLTYLPIFDTPLATACA